jgi:hypothetical protein
MERTGLGLPGIGPSLGTPTVGAPTGLPSSTNWLMVPRCTLKLEKCQGGLKLTCSCDDKMASSMVQNLCQMLAGGLCSLCCSLNGVTVCSCNLTMGLCKIEPTESGCCITCTSGDQQCCEMIQACCECVSCCLEAGCSCCVLLNNTPICIGCEPSRSGSKPASKR